MREINVVICRFHSIIQQQQQNIHFLIETITIQPLRNTYFDHSLVIIQHNKIYNSVFNGFKYINTGEQDELSPNGTVSVSEINH